MHAHPLGNRALYLCLGVVLLWPRSSAADAATDWNANAGRAALAACIAPGDDPLHESRMYAMMHVAIHDALNAIDRRYRPYALEAHVDPGTSTAAAVAAAARDVLVAAINRIPFPPACLQAGTASVEADYAAAIAAIPNGVPKTDGIQVGKVAAAAIFALSPVTAIHTADTDGNPDTTADPAWTPLQLTYPIPDHDSGHSVQGGAAAESLKQFFGTDDIAFSACSLTLPAGQRCTDASPVFRTYRSFSQAADENGLSRILVGIHFRNAVDEGIQHGRKIAKRAANLLLKPAN